MTLLDETIVTDPTGSIRYEEGVDYDLDYLDDRIKRLDSGSIPDGGDVRVFYGKEILSSISGQLLATGSAILPRSRVRVMQLSSPSQDPETGVDITDEITSLEIDLSISGPGKFRLDFADADGYTHYDPDSGIYFHISIGLSIDGGYVLQPVMLAMLEQRNITVDAPFHHLQLTGRDLSSLLDFPHSHASSLSFYPTYKREVFLNGVLIADDWRAEQVLTHEALNINDIVEIAYRRDYPMCHQAMREILKEAGWNLDNVSIQIIDFPLAGFDASGMSPLDALRDLASRVGATVRAEGETVVIASGNSDNTSRASWAYPADLILSLDENETDNPEYNAVRIYGHSETGLAPTRANLLPPIDPSKPGYAKLFEEEGTLTPEEPTRTDDPPTPFELTFKITAGTVDPYSLIVSGARLKENPLIDGNQYVITLLIDWLFEDTAGEPPYIIDENGDRRYFLRGVIYDAIPSSLGQYKSIPYANVERVRIDQPGNSSKVTCDDAGRYSFENVEKGVYQLIATHPSYLDNYSDGDPLNDVERDLTAEEEAYDEAIEEGRYLRKPTDFHVVVWGKPSTAAWGLTEHTVDQVRLEVRSASTLSGGELRYAPTVRDDNITTGTLAAEIGRIIISSSSATHHPRRIHLPLNPFLRPGEALFVSGGSIGISGSPMKLNADRVTHAISLTDGNIVTRVYSGEFDPSSIVLKHLGNDPYDSLDGVITGIMRDAQGVERCDVASGGSLYRGLARSPGIPPVKVGDAVIIARPSRNAVSYMVVARAVDVFGPERTVYV